MSVKCPNFVCLDRDEKTKTCRISHTDYCRYQDKDWVIQLAERRPEKLKAMTPDELWDLAYFIEYGIFMKEPRSEFCFFPPDTNNPFLKAWVKRTGKEVHSTRDRMTY